jgi:hypothetical protein
MPKDIVEHIEHQVVKTRLIELLRQQHEGALPVWVRAPGRGPEYYSGLTRPKLYQLHAEGKVRSVALREAGKRRGCRLWHLGSLLTFIESCGKEGSHE